MILRQFTAAGCCSVVSLWFFFSTNNSARADLIPWSVDFNATSSQVFSDQGNVAGITFLHDSTYENHGSGGVSTLLRTFIAPKATAGETFTFTDHPYNLVVKLKDGPSGAVGSLTFTGQFSGTLSMQMADITTTMSSPLIQHLRLGNDFYTVNLVAPPPFGKGGPNFMMPGPPSTVWPGGFQASISAQAIPRTPEPSSLVLAGLGALGLAARFGCRRVRRTA